MPLTSLPAMILLDLFSRQCGLYPHTGVAPVFQLNDLVRKLSSPEPKIANTTRPIQFKSEPAAYHHNAFTSISIPSILFNYLSVISLSSSSQSPESSWANGVL